MVVPLEDQKVDLSSCIFSISLCLHNLQNKEVRIGTAKCMHYYCACTMFLYIDGIQLFRPHA